MAHQITPFLMFDDCAEAAMGLYVSLFSNSRILDVERYGIDDEEGLEGRIKRASFALSGRRFYCIDSPVKHDFSFTPSISLFVECESEAEIRHAFRKLAEGGRVLMPLDDYGFGPLFAWLNDRYGLSWQLNLPAIPPLE